MTFVDGSTYLKSHYSLKHRITARLSKLLDGYEYTVRRGLTKGLKRKGGLGFIPAWIARSANENEETAFFEALKLDGVTVFDVGGFQGLLTMFFARRAKQVVVFEPNPSSRKRLLENLALNQFRNVVVRPVGVGETAGELELVFDPLMPGGASANSKVAGQIRSDSENLQVERMQIVSLDDEVAGGLPAPAFVKIDVEGMELGVLKGMRKVMRSAHPAIYIEMHGATMEEKKENARAVVAELEQSGYMNIRHIESGARITNANADAAARGHLYCQVR